MEQEKEKYYFIYGLKDSRDGIVRYIGRTCSPSARLRQHRCSPSSVKLREWVDSLPSKLLIEMEIFENTTSDDSYQIETGYILKYRRKNSNLLNTHVRKVRKGNELVDFHIYLPTATFVKLKEMAERNRRSISSEIIMAVEEKNKTNRRN